MDEFRAILAANGIPPEQIAAMEAFARLLLDTNKSLNLTRITDPAEMAYKHFLDSLAPDRLGLLPEGARVADVGTGAGFPGMVLAIARPDLHITMVEAQQKKVRFVRMAAEQLEIRAAVLQARSEELSRQERFRENFDCVVSRAVAGLPTLLELCGGLCARRGRFLAYKGVGAEEEVRAAAHAAEVMGLVLRTIHDAALQGRGHTILEYQKIRSLPTEGKYPRSYAKIKHSPL